VVGELIQPSPRSTEEYNVSKPAAKKAAPAKKPAAKAAQATKSSVKPSPKTTAKPASKPASTPAAKKAAPAKPAGQPKPSAAKATPKTPPKTTPKAAPKAPATSPAKPAASPAAKPQPASAKGAAPKPAKAAAHQPTPAPTVTPPTPAAAPARGRPSKSAAPAPAPAAPITGVTASRFADRLGTSAPSRALAVEPQRPAVKIDPKLVNVWKTKTAKELNDAEVLAMPDTEYMNEKQLEFFRLRLAGLKDDLLSNAGETTEHLREDTTIVPDPADRATIEEEHALELRTRDRERKLLKKIAQSLARIESGDYGYCDETGEPIGVARLLARPTATLSLEAQQRREMKQKMFGD
jgi:DnaK suppressor protein